MERKHILVSSSSGGPTSIGCNSGCGPPPCSSIYTKTKHTKCYKKIKAMLPMHIMLLYDTMYKLICQTESESLSVKSS